MLFSIITVTFNDVANLARTKESIISQSFEDFEWIVVDGNSTDRTMDFLDEINFDRIKIISENDKGLYDAMNKGIFISKGDYVIFLNSGDVFDNKNLLASVSNVIKDDPQLIYGDSKELSNSNQTFYKKSRSLWWYKVGMFTHHQAIFYNRRVLIDKNITYNQSYTIAGDYDFTINFIKNSDRFLYLPFSVCIFQQGGISHLNWKEGLRQQNEIRKKRFKMLLPKRVVIYVMQYSLHTLRFNINWLYNIFRFSKKN